MAQQQVENTIQFYESRVMEYPSPESWAVNILEATKLLTTGIAQTNFYRYLFSPTDYSFQTNIKTISKIEEEKYNELVKKFDATNPLKVKIYKNGSDAKIIYQPNKHNAKKIEPLVGISETIQSEEQIYEYENGNEGSEQSLQIQEDEKIDDEGSREI